MNDRALISNSVISNSCGATTAIPVGRRGGPPPPPNPPRTAATGQVFKIIFQDFGKIILKNNLEKKSRLFFKILAKIFLNKIIDFTTYLQGGGRFVPQYK